MLRTIISMVWKGLLSAFLALCWAAVLAGFGHPEEKIAARVISFLTICWAIVLSLFSHQEENANIANQVITLPIYISAWDIFLVSAGVLGILTVVVIEFVREPLKGLIHRLQAGAEFIRDIQTRAELLRVSAKPERGKRPVRGSERPIVTAYAPMWRAVAHV